MTSKNSFLGDLYSNAKMRTWNIAVFAVVMLICYPLFLGLVLRAENAAALYNSSIELVRIERLNGIFKDYMCFPSWDIVLATIFAFVSGIHGFSYLYSKKKIDLYMSIPVSKKRRFAVIYINGLLMYYIPLALCTSLCFAVAGTYGVIEATYFKTAVISAFVTGVYYFAVYNVVIMALMLTGNLVVTVLGGATLLAYENSVKQLILIYFSSFFRTFDSLSEKAFTTTWVSPFGIMASIYNAIGWEVKTASFYFEASKMYVIQMAVVGVAVLFISYLLYMKRPVESCGKAMSFKRTKNIIKRLILIPGALFGAAVFSTFSGGMNDIPVMILGMAVTVIIGHCVIQMIYEFDIKAVLSDKRSIIYCGAVSGIILAVFALDVFGYDKYIPDDSKLDHAGILVQFNNNYELNQYDDNWDYYSNADDTILKEMDIVNTSVVTNLAKENMPKVKEFSGNGTYVRVCYTLKNGRQVYRTFPVDFDNNEELLNALFADIDYKKSFHSIYSPRYDEFEENERIGYHNGISDGQEIDDTAAGFMNVYRQDFEKMTFSDIKASLPIGYVNITYDASLTDHRTIGLPVYESYKNTISYLNSKNLDMNYVTNPEDIDYIRASNWVCQHKEDENYNEEYGELIKEYRDKDQIEAILNSSVPGEFAEHSYVNVYNRHGGIDILVQKIPSYRYNNYEAYNISILPNKVPEFLFNEMHFEELEDYNNNPYGYEEA